jgi:hypothetical protein
MEEIIALPDNVIQTCNKFLGAYGSTYVGNNTYYLNLATQELIGYLGIDWVKENYKSYNQELLERLTKKLKLVKATYDAIEDKTFDKKNVEYELKRFYMKTASKVAPLEQPLHNLFWGFLNMRTSLHKFSIPNENWKVLEHRKLGVLSMDRRKPEPITEQIQKPIT